MMITLRAIEIELPLYYLLLQNGGGCPVSVWCEWWLLEDAVANACSFIESSFPGARV